MKAEFLDVIGVRFNPLRWATPERHYRSWVQHMLDSGVRLTVCEVQYGDRPFVCELPHVNHIGVRADSWVWSKENLINLAVQRLPNAKYICWEDADILHRNSDWAAETVHALQHYRAVQTWTQCLDLGPHGDVMSIHRSFAHCYANGDPVCADTPKWWKHDGGCYDYAHSGFSWACQREILNQVGGLFEFGAIGSGDYHMALGMVGKAEWSIIADCAPSYRDHILRWQARAQQYVNGRMAAVPGVIEHSFHGPKRDRGYLSRWNIFVRHNFDPDKDLKRNTFGVLEFAGNKPELEREFALYLAGRNEDNNCN